MIPLPCYLILAALVFGIGLLGIMVNRRNLILVLMSIELMLLGVNINFVAFSVLFQDISGQVFTFFILTVAACEAAIGLAILILYFRKHQTLRADKLNELKG